MFGRMLGLLFAAVVGISGCAAEPTNDPPPAIDLGPHMSQPCKLLTPQLRRVASISGEPEPGHANNRLVASCAAFNDVANTSGAPSLNVMLSNGSDATEMIAEHLSGKRITFQGYPAALLSQSRKSADDCEIGIDLGPKDGLSVTVFTRHDARPSPCELAKEAAAAIIDQLRSG